MPNRRLRLAASSLLSSLAIAAAQADINPWIAATLYDPGRWDTAGPQASTRWLHPGPWTPNQGWGVFGASKRAAKDGRSHIANLTGSWGGLRDDLFLDGVALSSAYFGQLASNPIGGQRRGTTWKSDLSLALHLDLERLIDLPGGYLTASFSNKFPGRSLSSDDVGNQFPVQLDSFDDEGAARLVHLAYGQQLLDNKVELVAGRLITGDDFASSDLACTSVNQAICGSPINAPQNISFPTFPNAVWGARAKLQPGKRWYLQIGTYAISPDFKDPDKHGADFSLNHADALTLAEVGFLDAAGSGGSARPGSLKIGAYYDSEQLVDLSTGDPTRGTWGLYAIAEKLLYSTDPGRSQGLSGFLSLSYAPPEQNKIDRMAVAGLSYRGLLPGRESDVAAFNVAYGHFSNQLAKRDRALGNPAKGFELMLELNYRIAIARWVFLQPDIQAIIHPGGSDDVDDALVVGFALGTVF